MSSENEKAEQNVIIGKSDRAILNRVMNYINNPKYKQAILFDGEWGSGKTYFVKNILMQEMRRYHKKAIYVSLNGLSSVDQVREKIFVSICIEKMEQSLHVDEKKDSKYYSEIIQSISEIGLKKYQDLGAEELRGLDSFLKTKEGVIVFDDLERCDIRISEIMGFINNYVEHEDTKVIIVASQSELSKKQLLNNLPEKYYVAMSDKVDFDGKEGKNVKLTKDEIIARSDYLFSEEQQYNSIKEKVVGLTIYYKNDVDFVLDNLADAYTNSADAAQCIKFNKDAIKELMHAYRHFNLRSIISGIIAFDIFYDVIDPLKEQWEEHLLDAEKKVILLYTMEVVIRQRNKMPLSEWQGENQADEVVFAFYNETHNVFGYRFIDEYIEKCIFDEEKIKSIINKAMSHKKRRMEDKRRDDSLSLNKLVNAKEMEDEDILTACKDLLFELETERYEPEDYKRIVQTLMEIRKMGFDNVWIEDYTKAMEDLIDNLLSPIKKSDLDLHSSEIDLTMEYYGYMAPVIERVEKNNLDVTKMSTLFISDVHEWNEEFAEKCIKFMKTYVDRSKFLGLMDLKKFEESMKIANAKEIWNFRYAMDAIYSRHMLYSDKKYVDLILEILDKLEIPEKQITKRNAVEKLKSKLIYYKGAFGVSNALL